MFKLPFLYSSKPDRLIVNQQRRQFPSIQNDEGVFRLKQLGKPVSHYESQKYTDQIQTVCPHKTAYSFQKHNLKKINFKRDQSQQIIQKAIDINNKHYPKSRSISKNKLKNSVSLDRNNFAKNFNQQTCLKSLQSTLKFKHPSRESKNSVSQVQTKLHKLKNTRSFRSEWFKEKRES